MSSTGELVWLVLGAAAVTAALKASGPVTAGGRRLPPGLLSACRRVSPSVVAALVVTQAFGDSDGVALGPPSAGVAACAGALILRVPPVAAIGLAALVGALI